MLEKGEYDKLVELLDKSLEKDSINAGAKYVYSLLYLTPKYKEYNIDTSYAFVNAAIVDFAKHDEKTIEDLLKLDINDSTLQMQVRAVETHAFTRAKAKNTIPDYDFFIQHFEGAIQSDSAVANRNVLAYNDAVKANTYEAFQYFIHTYPAADQIIDAKIKFEELLYFTKTKDHKLESYQRFLRNNPNTPYRDDAEKNIFEISTADNDPDSYMTFIEKYPESKMRKQALDMLYHCYKNFSSASQFSNRFDILREQDSLMRLVNAETGHLMPIFEMDKYGFSKLDGEKLIDFKYTKIKEDYYCGRIAEDYLEVELDGKPMIVSRFGDVIFEGQYDAIEDLGCGALKIEHDGYYGVIHKSGLQLLDFKYVDVGLVANAFLKFKFNGKWGLKTFSRRDILEPEYDDIYSEGRFVIVEDDELYAIQNVENLSKAADLTPPRLDFKFDDYDLVYASQLLLFKGDQETVMDLNLKENLGLDDQNFYEFYGGWLVKKQGKYKVYDQIFYPLSDLKFSKVDYNKSRAALKHESGWGIYNSELDFPSTFAFDSVRLLSEQFGIIVKGDTTFAVFNNDSIIDISYSAETRLLRPTSIQTSDEEKYSQYLLTKTRSGIYKVFDIDGKQILDGKFSSVEALGKEYLIVDRAGKKGLFHHSGKLALKVKYSAIGNYDNGYVSTLIAGKFGIFTFNKNVFLLVFFVLLRVLRGESFSLSSQ